MRHPKVITLMDCHSLAGDKTGPNPAGARQILGPIGPEV